jgi:hypothetical protein
VKFISIVILISEYIMTASNSRDSPGYQCGCSIPYCRILRCDLVAWKEAV